MLQQSWPVWYGISLYSVTAAGIYLTGCIALVIAFVSAYCTKCPIRDRCVHVVMGLMTGLMPDRPAGPYTRGELNGVIAFFGFIVLFPQDRLIREPLLILAFWVLFIGEWIMAYYACCNGCGNIYCTMRYDES